MPFRILFFILGWNSKGLCANTLLRSFPKVNMNRLFVVYFKSKYIRVPKQTPIILFFLIN